MRPSKLAPRTSPAGLLLACAAACSCASAPRPAERRVLVRLEPDVDAVLLSHQTGMFRAPRCVDVSPSERYYACTEAAWHDTLAALCARACRDVARPGELPSCVKVDTWDWDDPNVREGIGQAVLVCTLREDGAR